MHLLKSNSDSAQTSTVGRHGENIINRDVRHSLTIEGIKISNHYYDHDETKEITKHIKVIAPNNLHDLEWANLYENYNTSNSTSSDRIWKLHIYSPGGQFKKHSDGRQDSSHYGTLLLFPPNTINVFTGGELVFYDSGHEVARVLPHLFTQWTIFAFPINVDHCCLPVHTGTRYVFKSELNINPTIRKLVEVSKSSAIDVCEDDVQSLVADYQSQIIQLQDQMLRLKAHLPSKQSLEVIQKIEKSKMNRVVVLLERYYEDDNLYPNYLIGEDRLLFNEIVKSYPMTKMVNVTIQIHLVLMHSKIKAFILNKCMILSIRLVQMEKHLVN